MTWEYEIEINFASIHHENERRALNSLKLPCNLCNMIYIYEKNEKKNCRIFHIYARVEFRIVIEREMKEIIFHTQNDLIKNDIFS